MNTSRAFFNEVGAVAAGLILVSSSVMADDIGITLQAGNRQAWGGFGFKPSTGQIEIWPKYHYLKHLIKDLEIGASFRHCTRDNGHTPNDQEMNRQQPYFSTISVAAAKNPNGSWVIGRTSDGSSGVAGKNGTDVSPDVSIESKQKHLINWPQSAVIGAPPNLLDRWDYIETLPFDGVVIFTPDFRVVMTPGKTVTYQKVYADSQLGDLAKKFKRVKNNFLMIWAAPAPLDAFDNWDGIIANFAVYAKAAKNAGCLGIVFDNEQYRGGIWNYPQNVLHSDSYSIEPYRVQMRLRGKQIMAAMISEFPGVQFRRLG